MWFFKHDFHKSGPAAANSIHMGLYLNNCCCVADQVPSVDGYIISHSPATNPNSPLNHCNTLSEHALFLAAHHSKEKEKIRNSEAENCLFRQKINIHYTNNVLLFVTVRIIYRNNDAFVLMRYIRGSEKQTCSVPAMRFNLYIDETDCFVCISCSSCFLSIDTTMALNFALPSIDVVSKFYLNYNASSEL